MSLLALPAFAYTKNRKGYRRKLCYKIKYHFPNLHIEQKVFQNHSFKLPKSWWRNDVLWFISFSTCVWITKKVWYNTELVLDLQFLQVAQSTYGSSAGEALGVLLGTAAAVGTTCGDATRSFRTANWWTTGRRQNHASGFKYEEYYSSLLGLLLHTWPNPGSILTHQKSKAAAEAALAAAVAGAANLLTSFRPLALRQ